MEMEKDKIVFKGSHPDSLYRVAADSSAGASKVTKVLRVVRWPVALIAVCVALAVFVYFLMPDNMETRSVADNGTYWEPVLAAGHWPHSAGQRPLSVEPSNEQKEQPEHINVHGTKPSEIDFYADENDKNYDLTTVVDTITEITTKRILPIPPVFPTHLTPEVQYGNEKADSDNLRTTRLWEDADGDDTTLKPHITQKPEKPLAIYFKDGNEATTTTTETLNLDQKTKKYEEKINDFTNYDQKPKKFEETINDFNINYDQKPITRKIEETPAKTRPSAYKEYAYGLHKEHRGNSDFNSGIDRQVPLELQEYFGRRPSNEDVNFTSGHSKLFGISIEDAEKIKSTTQSSLYNTRVSPTLPTWRDGDDTTTKKYPTNVYSEVQCRSTRLSLCRGVLPYDLAGMPARVGNVEISSLLSQIEYLVSTNCSERVRHFVCALLEPECNPPPYPSKLPCYNLCKAIVDNCDGQIPSELIPVFNCKQYFRSNCVNAKTPCYAREFTCSDGTCVPKDWICDGTKDCPSGEDEATCIQCDQSEYRCSSGGCILKRWLCDGYADCPGGEDEHEATCGAGDAGDGRAAGDAHEPGEEPSGSAPAPAVTRPNRVPIGRKGVTHRSGDNESSKELLVTSDSNNALKRNYTRRPSPSRLSKYYRPSPKRGEAIIEGNLNHQENDKVFPTDHSVSKPEVKKTDGEKALENESIEDVNMGDLGFFGDSEKEGKDQGSNPTEQKVTQRNKWTGAVPPPSPTVLVPATKATHLDKSSNKLNRVIDGAALLRKAAEAQAADLADDTGALNDTLDVSYDTAATDGTAKGGIAVPVDLTDIDAGPPAKSGSTAAPRGGAAGGGGGTFSAGEGDWSRARASPCPSGELRCVDGRCITLSQLCDGSIDCSDHADEDNCYT